MGNGIKIVHKNLNGEIIDVNAIVFPKGHQVYEVLQNILERDE